MPFHGWNFFTIQAKALFGDLVKFVESEIFVASFGIVACFLEQAWNDTLTEALKLWRNWVDDFVAIFWIFTDLFLKVTADEAISKELISVQFVAHDTADFGFESEHWVTFSSLEVTSWEDFFDVIEAEQAANFFDDIFFDVDISAPCWCEYR